MMEAQVQIRSYSPEVGHHLHDFHQLILPFNGTMELETDRGGGRVSNAVAAFVPAGERHSFIAADRSRFIVLDLPADDGLAIASTPGGFFHVEPALRGLLDYLQVAAAESEIATDLQTAWTCLLLDRLGKQPVPTDRDAAPLRRALTFAREHLEQPLQVADMARAAGVSVSRLHRIMRARLQTTPHGCLVSLRLDAAEKLLAEGRLSIAEIAVRTGHTDQSALTRALRRQRGITPARFRGMFEPRGFAD